MPIVILGKDRARRNQCLGIPANTGGRLPPMSTQLSPSQMRRYAVTGAETRLVEISQEADAIRRIFPELGRLGAGENSLQGGTRSVPPGNRNPVDSPSQGNRRTMSAAERKAVGERMKKYWTGRRAGSAASSAAGGEQQSAAAALSSRGGARRGPRTMSAEARKRISDAQKARWTKQRGTTAASDSSATPAAIKGRRTSAKRGTPGAANRGTRKRSAAARKRMSEAQKKRWAAKRDSQQQRSS